MDKRIIFLEYAKRFIKTPYLWGGNDPMAGFDCSGFVIECLKAVGLLPYRGDWTAHAIWVLFKQKEVQAEVAQPGCLVFWESISERMTHIEIVVTAELSLGASGGGSKTDTLQDAIDSDAYIKMRPFKGRDGRLLYFADPFKSEV